MQLIKYSTQAKNNIQFLLTIDLKHYQIWI